MTEREQFEAWWSKRNSATAPSWAKQDAWEAWQAVRAAPALSAEQKAEMIAMLQSCLQYAYNSFEPDNQSKHYKRLHAYLDKIGGQ
jgi:hypothetical protein